MRYKYPKSRDIIVRKNRSPRLENIADRLKACFINSIINHDHVAIVLMVKLTWMRYSSYYFVFFRQCLGYIMLTYSYIRRL